MDWKLVNDKAQKYYERQKLNEAKKEEKVTVINVSSIHRMPIKRKEIDITKL